jgi:UDP-N-acetylglucosamine 2-epimerase (non-hydrolysing)
MIIHLVCGARPNFMKVAPLYHRLKQEPWAVPVIVHTGQHYDAKMSDSFFDDLGLPAPHIYLGVGSGSHAVQTAKTMIAYDDVLATDPPDLVIVVGDVNSTVAATLTATKRGIKVAHLEAGLRSYDRTMPEEINRMATDAIADLLWPPSPDGVENLIREGVSPARIQLVGNIMIDSLEMMRHKMEAQDAHLEFGLEQQNYGVVTLHRPSNVDDPATLGSICEILKRVSERLPLVFPVHPRTRLQMEQSGLLQRMGVSGRIVLPEPLNYIRFMSLVMNSRLVITDSGGIQEETTHLGIPCLTVRENTERPITITHGTNQLCGLENLAAKAEEVATGRFPRRVPIDLWDGRTADRIVAFLKQTMAADTARVVQPVAHAV